MEAKLQKFTFKNQDKNTNLFHKQVKERDLQNNVIENTREDGENLEKFTSTKEEAYNHFKLLFIEEEEEKEGVFDKMLHNIHLVITP